MQNIVLSELRSIHGGNTDATQQSLVVKDEVNSLFFNVTSGAAGGTLCAVVMHDITSGNTGEIVYWIASGALWGWFEYFVHNSYKYDDFSALSKLNTFFSDNTSSGNKVATAT